ncbi:MAG: hypothetical protein WCR27_04795 [Eubacteriales bacterium]
MKVAKIVFVILIINCLFFNTTTVLAVGFNIVDSPGVQKTVITKDKIIMEKLEKAKQWIEQEKPLIAQFFSNKMSEFRIEIDRMYNEIKVKLNEFKNRQHTFV